MNVILWLAFLAVMVYDIATHDPAKHWAARWLQTSVYVVAFGAALLFGPLWGFVAGCAWGAAVYALLQSFVYGPMAKREAQALAVARDELREALREADAAYHAETDRLVRSMREGTAH